MLVKCPNCHTTYRVSDVLITIGNPTFRCSRCKHIFVLGLKPDPTAVQKTTPHPPTAAQQNEPENQELTFSFPPPARKEMRDNEARETTDSSVSEQAPVTEEREEKPPESPPAPIPEPFQPSGERRASPAAGDETSNSIDDYTLSLQKKEREDSWSLASSTAAEEKSFIIPKESQFPSVDDTIERDQGFEEEWSHVPSPVEIRESSSTLDPDRERPLSIIPYISLFWAILLIFSLITLMHRAQPNSIEAVIKTIPWLGFSVFRNNHLRQGIVLQSLRSSFQTIRENREVFVISGVAVNRNPVGVREVRIEGHIFNAEGKEIGSQAMSVGNAISTKIIRDLEAKEISILQELKPQKRFVIPPQESTPFVIVFSKPSGEIKNFSCRVLSAESI